MSNKLPYHIKTIQEFHLLRGLPAPEHPLISIIDYSVFTRVPDATSWTQNFYSVSLKRTTNTKIKYGQQIYDFDRGVLFFIAPNQVFSISANQQEPPQHTGWLLLIHPDFLWNTPLAKTIKQYDFFDYSVNEALFLSEKEETIINGIIENIHREYQSNIDKFSQQIIISQLETLLGYSQRFYNRQFITRKKSNHQILDRLEKLLTDYFEGGELTKNGLPGVEYISQQLHVSPGYLRGLLKSLTGQSTQEHIHNRVIEKAKEKLSTTSLSVSEIAYELGFDRPQSFSRLFKIKTQLSPLEFRESFQ